MPHSECFIDGIWYPSVTTIMGAQPKPWLQAWREKWGPLAERKTKLANEIGAEVHRCIEQYLKVGDYSISEAVSPFCHPRIDGMMASFIEWAANVEGDVHETELKVVSHLHTYSGTLDAVGTLNGRPIIYDWKTSSRIYDDMQLQLSAYAEAYNEQTGAKVKDGIIVCVSKDKPRFKLTARKFKLGKRVLNKFLKLRAMFDDVKAREAIDAEGTVDEAAGC